VKRTREPVDPAAWDRFVKANQGHILQTSSWGVLKSKFGWDHEIVMVDGPDGIVSGAMILFRRVPLGLGVIAYVPRGPIVDWADEQAVQTLFGALDYVAKDRRAALLKVEADIEDTPENRDRMRALGFRPSPQTVQPPRTVLLDISGSEDDILARMNQGTRRKIRTAQKREVVVRRGRTKDVDSFCALSELTGTRDGFSVHSPAYYREVYDLFAARYGALFMASYEGTDLGGLMVLSIGRRAWYLYGASSNDERDRMPNYALQWTAIQWARAHGCTEYDLWGIPDEDEDNLEKHFQQRHDGLWGVYGFKRGFGGKVYRAVGAWDRVYNPAIYTAYRLAVRTRD
jgi:lipid II:glycine glycyltransferase (peptidoglycan interpeptide bridge formation enzyme)